MREWTLSFLPRLCGADGRPGVSGDRRDARATAQRGPRQSGPSRQHGVGDAHLPHVNGDGAIDGLDVLGIAVAFNSTSGGPRFSTAADRDLNGLVDGQDLAYVSAFYAQSCP